eukprot:gene4743-3426_t
MTYPPHVQHLLLGLRVSACTFIPGFRTPPARAVPLVRGPHRPPVHPSRRQVRRYRRLRCMYTRTGVVVSVASVNLAFVKESGGGASESTHTVPLPMTLNPGGGALVVAGCFCLDGESSVAQAAVVSHTFLSRDWRDLLLDGSTRPTTTALTEARAS